MAGSRVAQLLSHETCARKVEPPPPRQLTSRESSMARAARSTARNVVSSFTMTHLLRYERADYSVVVKNRAPPPKSWRWEIYRAGNAGPIKLSSIYFDARILREKRLADKYQDDNLRKAADVLENRAQEAISEGKPVLDPMN
jgi:hypothetical protein